MSLNAVSVQNEVPILTNPEQAIGKPFLRVSLTLTPIHPKSSKVITGSGTLSLTTHRLVFISHDQSQSQSFRSFSVPIPNVQNARVSQPWIGPNKWVADIVPVPNGGFDPEVLMFSVQIGFGEGGAFSFLEQWVKLVENWRNGIHHGDQLPQYSLYSNDTTSSQPITLNDNDLPPPYPA